jgi:hypothetical protein
LVKVLENFKKDISFHVVGGRKHEKNEGNRIKKAMHHRMAFSIVDRVSYSW